MTIHKSKASSAVQAASEPDQRRRRWSGSEKAALVARTYEPGMSVSLVAREHGVTPSRLYLWRSLERNGGLTAVSAGESVVPASELASARVEIARLQRVLGKKTLEAEILKEAIELAREKKWIASSPLFPGDAP
jgi:transposase